MNGFVSWYRVQQVLNAGLDVLEKLIPAQAVAVAQGRDFDAAERKAAEVLNDPDDGGEALEPFADHAQSQLARDLSEPFDLGPYTHPEAYEHIRPPTGSRVIAGIDQQVVDDMKRDVAANQKNWGDLGRLIHVQYVYEIIDRYLTPQSDRPST